MSQSHQHQEPAEKEDVPIPSTFEAALEMFKELSLKRDKLLHSIFV